jgi:DNA-binding response OmpR family regulator
MKILVIEDDFGISTMIRSGLEEAHYQIRVAKDGVKGLELARTHEYGLLILDIMLPKLDGWQICERLRAERNQTPILMVTARNSVDDRVRGLDIGADDYLPKPFEFRELLARVRALARRERVHRSNLIHIGDLEIDTVGKRVSRAGESIQLSHREFELLEALASNEGRVLDRQTVRDRVWLNDAMSSNMVDVYVRALRNKIDRNRSEKLIKTIHGVGYCLESSLSNRAYSGQ